MNPTPEFKLFLAHCSLIINIDRDVLPQYIDRQSDMSTNLLHNLLINVHSKHATNMDHQLVDI